MKPRQLLKLFLLIMMHLDVQNVSAENDHYLQFKIQFNHRNVNPESMYLITKSDSITIETLKFYISSIQIHDKNGKAFNEENSYHLLDIQDSNSLKIKLLAANFDNISSIEFNLGIDSITNFSGAHGGDLDPTKGMYWTWQNGYINFKLEGKSNKCETRNHEFQFHLGGYQFPDNSLQTVNLNAIDKESVNIIFDLGKLLDEIDLAEQNHIVSPGKEAVLLSENISKCFILK